MLNILDLRSKCVDKYAKKCNCGVLFIDVVSILLNKFLMRSNLCLEVHKMSHTVREKNVHQLLLAHINKKIIEGTDSN